MTRSPILRLQSIHDVDFELERKEQSLRFQIEAGRLPADTTLYHYMASALSIEQGGFWWGDMNSRLEFTTSSETMEAIAYGPTSAGLVLREAVATLGPGDEYFRCQANHGLHVRFSRSEDGVVLERVRERIVSEPTGSIVATVVTEEEAALPAASPFDLAGPAVIEAEWDEFVDAVDAYWLWVLTDHAREAPWLELVPEFRQWQIDAGVRK